MPSHKSVNLPSPQSKALKVAAPTKKTTKPKPVKTSLAKLKAGLAPMVPVRVLRARAVDVVAEAMRQRMEALDKQIGVMPALNLDEEDDTDYLQSVPGRPGQFTTTFSSVYGSALFLNGQYFIDCAEPGCPSKALVMNSKWVELNARGTPHGRPRKPPVCHNVPWTALEMAMLDRERLKPGRYTDHFRKTVCWHVPNLRAGHNGCNAAGVKTQANNITTAELRAAAGIIDNVEMSYFGQVWQ